MKSLTRGAGSGCVIWLIVLCLISSCFIPVALAIGAFTSITAPAVNITAPYICPPDTTPRLGLYQTISTDANGFDRVATAYVLECLDAQGEVIKEDPIAWTFLWLAICTAIGLVLTAVVSLLIAAPAGAWIGRLAGRSNDNPI